MKKNIVFKKRLYLLLAAGISSFTLLTACSSKNEKIEEIKDEKKENTTNDENNIQSEDNINKDENAIVNYFLEKQDELNKNINESNGILYTENIELTNEIWSSFFIDAVDIIFYGKEYDNTSFNNLSAEQKQKCLDIITEFSEKMTKLNPNWQEDLGDIKESSATFYYNTLESVKNLIGEDKYNKLQDFKNSIIENSENLFNDITTKTDQWYQEYKSKNK